MGFGESRKPEPEMSAVDIATMQVNRMVEREVKGWGDQAPAVARIARVVGVSTNTLDRLRTGKAKTISADLRDRIRASYVRHCERQIVKLQAEIEAEKALRGTDDTLADLENEASRLAAKVREIRERTGK